MSTIHKVEYEQKSILRNLLELYKYDFSEFDPDDDLNSNGLQILRSLLDRRRKKSIFDKSR